MGKLTDNKYVNIFILVFSVYLFLVGIKLIALSFKLASGHFVVELLNRASNPFIGIFIGILVTSLVQSSSSTTSLTVALVAAGTIKMDLAIYIVMGANIGTSITNILVSLPHISRKNEFEHAFAAATVHDFFNLITVFFIFPLEFFFGYLSRISGFLTGVFENMGGLVLFKPVDVMTKPAVSLLKSLLSSSPFIIGIVAILLLFVALRNIVVSMRRLVLEKIRGIFGTYFFKNYFRSMLSGTVITSIVQSSSVTTSLAVPFAAARILTLEQIFPYTLGANLGTTVTALIASLSIASPLGLQVALAHLIFNITGIILITPIKKVPLFLAGRLAHYSVKNRLIPLFYVIIQFFVIPLIMIYMWR
jgi:sodium-dependent phosphate cotransporter